MGSEEDQEVLDPLRGSMSFHSKVPIAEKNRESKSSDVLSKMIGLDTLYGVLSEEHLGLQITLKETLKRLKSEEMRRKDVEVKLRRDNPINLALAERIQALEESEIKLKRCNADLREENDLLEFRLLEMEDNHNPIKRTVSRASESRTDAMDDVSDSGVMSLPTSDDEHHEFNIEIRSDRDVKSRLMKMCQSVSNVSERICLQQAFALLRHYEARIEGLESTISAMCHEATMARTLANQKIECAELENKNAGRIIATVLPFSEPVGSLKNSTEDVKKLSELGESGIFEECNDRSTQTEMKQSVGDLSTELEKLSRIRERMEWKGGKQVKKDVSFYETRLATLEERLSAYESSGEDRVKALKTILGRNMILSAQVQHLKEKIERLEKDKRFLEDERSELEEIENDTRLHCQRLELKLSSLSDKKKKLKLHIQDLKFEMAEREEKERESTAKMEALVNSYEKKNQELEEKELEIKYRIQMLENTMPALMMWNIWRMMMSVQGSQVPTGVQYAATGTTGEHSSATLSASREEELGHKLRGLEGKLTTQAKLLEESRIAEDELRRKLRDLEGLLSKEHHNLDVPESDVDHDVQLFEKLGKMAKDRLEMDKRIKELELKEKLYKETLEQADNVISDLEGQFNAQLKEKELTLNDHVARLADNEKKLRAAEKANTASSALEEKVLSLDSELKQLRNQLTSKDKEKVALEDIERKLLKELQDAMNELDRVRGEIDGPMKNQLEDAKKKVAFTEAELKAAEDFRNKLEQEHKSEVNFLKNQLYQLNRELMENDVTVSELKEEVQTLEMAVDELRFLLNNAKLEKDEIVKQLEMKLENKEREIEFIVKNNQYEGGVSLREELEENGYGKEDIEYLKGEYRFTTSHELSECFKGEPDGVVLNQIIDTDQDDFLERKKFGPIVDKWREVISKDFKDLTAVQFQSFAAIVESGDPPFDNCLSIHKDFPISRADIPYDCKVAQNAVAGASGKDVKGTVDNLTKAYQHSKTCGACNERIGTFLDDIIKQLGVKLPRVKDLGKEELRYAGQPSALKTKELGPGTVGWDPDANEAGFKLKPTVSSLELSVEELKEKCRTKDCMIESMANELRYLQSSANWDETRMMNDIADHPTTDAPDFDRYTLHRYIKSEKLHGFDDREEGEEYYATNPLGLTVVRQVGPDSLLIKWKPPPPNQIYAFELFVNGLFFQRIRSPGRTKTLLYPIELDSKVAITLNTVTYTGEVLNETTVRYP